VVVGRRWGWFREFAGAVVEHNPDGRRPSVEARHVQEAIAVELPDADLEAVLRGGQRGRSERAVRQLWEDLDTETVDSDHDVGLAVARDVDDCYGSRIMRLRGVREIGDRRRECPDGRLDEDPDAMVVLGIEVRSPVVMTTSGRPSPVASPTATASGHEPTGYAT
jgi:hypothetical protein